MGDFLKHNISNYARIERDGTIVLFTIPGQDKPDYEIVRDAYDSKPKILHWVAHLLPKVWVTKEHIEVFLALVETETKIGIHCDN